MTRAVSLLSLLLGLMGYALAGLNIWPSFHVALSNASVFVDFNSKANSSLISQLSLSLIDMDTNATLLTRTLPNKSVGRVEFNCTCFLYAGTFRFLLRQTSTTEEQHSNGTRRSETTAWWWSSELRVQWPTFHIAVERVGNHSGAFQIVISTNEHFQPCSGILDPALLLEVSFMEYNHVGRKGINKVQARTQHPIRPLRSQKITFPCAFPFTEKDFIQVSLRSPHLAQELKSSVPLYLSHIFPYKLQVERANTYRSGCDGTMTVKLVTPPCAHIDGKVLLYQDSIAGRRVGVSSGMVAGGTAAMGFGQEEPSSPPLAFNWLTQGENETEFNCSVFYPGRSKYCFRFVFNYSRSPSPAQTCLVVHRSEESWGPWKQWSVCSVSCGEGVRERVRECLLPSGVEGKQCTGMRKKQSICSLEDCAALQGPSPSLPPLMAGVSPLSGNMAVFAGISLCLAVILATIVITVWRKFCHSPQCSSVRRGSAHSHGGRKLSEEASICGSSLPRSTQIQGPFLGTPLPQTTVLPLSQDPERLSPTGQKVLPPIFGYRLAQQQLKEMKKKGLKEATQMYHVSSSPVHDTSVETKVSTNTSPIAFSLSELPSQASRITANRLSPRADLVSAPGSKWHDRTADWVEMVKRSGVADVTERPMGHAYLKNPNFRRTSSFSDTKSQLLSSGHFRDRSMTQVGSRTLPEGNSWTKERRQRPSFSSYPIPEHDTPKLSHSKGHSSDQRNPRIKNSPPPHSNEVKHTGTNTSQRHVDHCNFGEKSSDLGSRAQEGISGIGGPLASPDGQYGANLSVERAEQNWNRRGPSPIQRNMLARKLKEAQACLNDRGRQRSATFSVPTLYHGKDNDRPRPGSGCYNVGNKSSTYKLSEVEQKMLDFSPTYAEEEI
ncbi:thrombospondin type-1 domain-containing protein 1 [Corythoichthys intestinalis]|uniref:thrombospondin type-1 domain-containing protein 1 n=1 Tax=Corythoichthys intestinalis TaxID=161448 RepID=UPI0025A6334D|nr:thrombospondin type-1 domain-containing protein 1 [Corythoichthys intestinalis]XP_061801177.1 thrombospondin type-1 domain-containing protein 1-like [Nerophis lumbriciformis]